jgi:hypothetical protein
MAHHGFSPTISSNTGRPEKKSALVTGSAQRCPGGSAFLTGFLGRFQPLNHRMTTCDFHHRFLKLAKVQGRSTLRPYRGMAGAAGRGGYYGGRSTLRPYGNL